MFTFYQAQARALKLARGGEGNKPVTVSEALDAYETDLAARGGSQYNATSVRNYCSPAMLSKVVMLLGDTEATDWRNSMIAKGLKLSIRQPGCEIVQGRWHWLAGATNASPTAPHGRTA
jgi:hypothetical protein